MASQDASARVINDFFTRQLKVRADKEAIVFKDKRIKWTDYDRETDRAAMGLLKLGVKKGDRIGIYFPNCLELIFNIIGCAKIGAVAVPIAWRFTAQELKFLLNNAEISVVIMAAGFMGMDFVKTLDSIRAEVPTLKKVVILEKDKALPWMIPYDQYIAEPGPELVKAKADVKPDDAYIFIYTSGTTGIPKAAVLTHKNVIKYTDGQLESAKNEGDLTGLLNIPLNHVGGAVMGLVASLNYGTKLILMDWFDPEKTLADYPG